LSGYKSIDKITEKVPLLSLVVVRSY